VAEDSDRAFLLARDVTGIRIAGPGTIDGQGRLWTRGVEEGMGVVKPARLRPRTLVVENSRDVEIDGVHIILSPMWTTHLINSDHVRVTNVHVLNDMDHPNTDAVVVDGCRDVTIEDSVLHTADDGVVLKTSRAADGSTRSCERVGVHRTEVRSNSCALKIGTESFADFKDLAFEDCRIVASNRALGVFSRDGGAVHNVRFKRIDVDCRETPDGFWGSGEALTINVVDRRPNERPAGEVDGVLVEDLTGVMEGAINIVRDGGAGISNVVLRRVRLRQRPGDLGTGRSFDLRPTPADLTPPPGGNGRANSWIRGADGKIVGLHPYPGGTPGVYVENTRGVTLEDVVVERIEPEASVWNPEVVTVTPGRLA